VRVRTGPAIGGLALYLAGQRRGGLTRGLRVDPGIVGGAPAECAGDAAILRDPTLGGSVSVDLQATMPVEFSIAALVTTIRGFVDQCVRFVRAIDALNGWPSTVAAGS
jgi:hypothetical protein